jgi:hypothetical protein
MGIPPQEQRIRSRHGGRAGCLYARVEVWADSAYRSDEIEKSLLRAA